MGSFRKLTRQLRDYATGHLISSVLVVLLVSWVTVSWLVYLAERKAQGANITSYGEALWWGVVSFLTVGYGDRVPVTAEGRVWAVFLMFAGVFGVAVITSKISSYFLEQALREGKGIVETSKLKDHFVVCGWKEDMHELLHHILDFNPGLTSNQLVLVAAIGDQVIAHLKTQPRLKGLQIIQGPYWDAVNLKRSAPERARKVLILADRAPNPNGQIPSLTEVDARTIMTAMTLSSIARGTLVTAEILDPKMDQYLKIAQVSEIIYSREYSRLLLGNASGGTGLCNILFDLLDPKTTTRIATLPIDEKWMGKAYSAFKTAYETEHPRTVVIGILENTGNSHRIKELALRQAQKTPDMNKLLHNLRSVREIKCNHPVFNPIATYLLQDGSMAMVIESEDETLEATNDAGTKETNAVNAA